jgi:hypothetical protein
MRLADTTRPLSKPDTTLCQPDKAGVDAYAVTPADGLDTGEIPKVPMRPEEVLTLLEARLALDHDDRAAVLAEAIPHEAATLPTTTWPPTSGARGKVPSYPDITPSPIVIGLSEDEEVLQSNIDAAVTACGATKGWREPATENTPAEPIASVRVRQASHADKVSDIATASLEGADRRSGLVEASVEESISERLYFPPMKPPESWQDDRAHEPLVQVVPDCDTKTRTARSLRRPSSRPAPPTVQTYGWRWSLLLTGAALAVIFTVVMLMAPSIRPLKRDLAGSGVPAFPLLSPEPMPGLSNATSPSSRPDSGATSGAVANERSVPKLLTPLKPAALPSASAGASSSPRSDAPKVPPAPKNQDRARDGNRVKPHSPGNDGLVF